jgi:hypothetical protein
VEQDESDRAGEDKGRRSIDYRLNPFRPVCLHVGSNNVQTLPVS